MKDIPTFKTWQGHTDALDWLSDQTVSNRMQLLVIKACRKAYEAGRKHERFDPRKGGHL